MVRRKAMKNSQRANAHTHETIFSYTQAVTPKQTQTKTQIQTMMPGVVKELNLMLVLVL
jgi:hypothetical protein